MPVSVAAQNTTTATVGSDITLVTQAGPSSGAAYMLRLDTHNMVAGDTVRIRLSSRARAAGTTRVAYEGTFAGVQGERIKLSPIVPVESGNEVVAVLTQLAGTARAFDWALVRIDG